MLMQRFVCPHNGRHVEIQVLGDKHGNYLVGGIVFRPYLLARAPALHPFAPEILTTAACRLHLQRLCHRL
jgi:biotin carboxylase